MKILTVRQPWAHLIAAGIKDIENRTWSTPYRGVVIIHAAGRWWDGDIRAVERRHGIAIPRDLPLGGVVGCVHLADVVAHSASPWFLGPPHYAFVLRGGHALPFIRWTGSLGLRDAAQELLDRLTSPAA